MLFHGYRYYIIVYEVIHLTDTETLNKILSEITENHEIALNDIPDIDLYMDQVTTLFENKLNPLKRNEDDKILTKTMINNYAKAKIFPPVKSKKYTKDQIILLSLIYNLKQSLSLSDIRIVFNSIIDSESTKGKYNIEELYDTFLQMKKNELDTYSNRFNDLLASIQKKTEAASASADDKKELILLVFILIAKANTNIRMCEKIIDTFFKSDPVK